MLALLALAAGLSLAAPLRASAETAYAAVTLNGAATGAVLELKMDDGRVVADGADLAGLGMQAPGGPVALNDLAGVSFAFDDRTQTLAITAEPRALKSHSLKGREPDPTPPSRADWGGLVNYAVYGLAAEGTGARLSGFGEVRLFGPLGSISSGFASSAQTRGGRPIRLNTSYTLDDPAKGRRLVVGDFISAGLPWARSVRAGGVSFASDFALRPDLITQPIPAVSGSAAAPSTVDLYVNGVQRYSSRVGAGPFTVDQVPLADGQGQVRMVVTDLLGQSSVQSFPYYVSGDLLRPGLSSYAFEAGFVRLGYAGADDRYDQGFAMAGGRRGLTDALTVEGHAEAASDLGLAGVGATAKLGQAAIVSGAVSSSWSGAGSGFQYYLSARRRTDRYSLYASLLDSSDHFEDLAARSGDARVRRQLQAGGSLSLDRWGQFNASYLELKTSNTQFGSVSLGWSHRLPFGGTVYANGYMLTRGGDGHGITVGLSVPLGRRGSAGGSVSAIDDGWTSTAYAAHTSADGALAWGASMQTADGRLRQAEANARLVGSRGEAGLSAAWAGGRAYGQAYLRGSAVWLAGDRVRLASTVSDSFALVDAGAPGIDVAVENRVIGRSGPDGRLLALGLRGLQPVTLAISATSVPLDYAIDRGSERVRPPRGAGVNVSLPVRPARARSLHLILAGGGEIPVGAQLELNGEDAGVVGYDGAAYLQTAASRNQITLRWPGGGCAGSFAGAPEGGPPGATEVSCQPLTYAQNNPAAPPAKAPEPEGLAAAVAEHGLRGSQGLAG